MRRDLVTLPAGVLIGLVAAACVRPGKAPDPPPAAAAEPAAKKESGGWGTEHRIAEFLGGEGRIYERDEKDIWYPAAASRERMDVFARRPELVAYPLLQYAVATAGSGKGREEVLRDLRGLLESAKARQWHEFETLAARPGVSPDALAECARSAALVSRFAKFIGEEKRK